MKVAKILDHADNVSDRVLLDFDQRSRRRAVLQSEGGRSFILDEDRSRHLRSGQVFLLEDGSCIRIEASPEELVAISCSDLHQLVRIAWHLGNRHLATQIIATFNGGELRIRADHVIEAMAEGLGGICRRISAPFDPEGGAYERDGQRFEHHHSHGRHSHGVDQHHA